MNKQELLSIGDLSRITRLSVRTLRYYDEIELLKPRYIDPASGYRYYSKNQLLYIDIIQDLKSFDFTLDEIKEAFKREDLKMIKNLYLKKQDTVRNQMEQLSKTDARITKRLDIFREIEEAEKILTENNEEFRIQLFKERMLLSKRYVSAFDNDTVIKRVSEIQDLLENQAESPYVIIFHENYEAPDNTDLEIGTFVSGIAPKNIAFTRIIPAGYYATAIIKGPHATSIDIYRALLDWIKQIGHRSSGAPMKVYIRSLAFAKTKKELITQLQIPLAHNT